jgi:hypothetical protein
MCAQCHGNVGFAAVRQLAGGNGTECVPYRGIGDDFFASVLTTVIFIEVRA